jgi:hypothetical protein
MRLPIPSGLVARWLRRLAGLGPEARLGAVRIYPRSIEIAVERPDGCPEEIRVAPRGGWRWVLLALAPLLFVTLAPRARLHARIGGLPYALDALITAARMRRRRRRPEAARSKADAPAAAPVRCSIESGNGVLAARRPLGGCARLPDARPPVLPRASWKTPTIGS